VDVKFVLQREIFQDGYTLGRLYKDGVPFGYTCEDCDRELEAGGVKVPGETAIPAGLYRLSTSLSARFKRWMPIVKDVPQFSGVRIHGGNKSTDTLGCPLLGAVRTAVGVAGCSEVNIRLLAVINAAEKAGGKCWLEVRNGKLA